MPRPRACDGWLFLTAGLLVVGGLLMVGSASPYVAMAHGKTPHAFLVRQMLHALAGGLALIAAMSVHHRWLGRRWIVIGLIAGSIVLLVAVLMAPPVAGVHRWLRLGPLTLQPSEFAKLAAVVFMAYFLSLKHERIRELWVVPVPCMAVVGVLAFLTAIEPDLGSAVMFVLIGGLMLFVAGVRWRHMGALAVLGLVGFVVAVVAEPYRLERLRTFVDPEGDVQGAGFQLSQSLIALGSGGVTGVGPGQGQQKAFFLPAPHTDFIYAVVGEELGLIGTGVLLVAFMLLFWRGMRTALRAPDRLGFLLALGLTHLLVLQALINMGVCLGLLPTKGLPLPFISYGGSSLMASMIGTGLLLNLSQYSN